uniref:Secreted protein n=1 Tax=Steinernema glaseri TaxID=37863 RepID=A0A1I7YH87_9BILA
MTLQNTILVVIALWIPPTMLSQLLLLCRLLGLLLLLTLCQQVDAQYGLFGNALGFGNYGGGNGLGSFWMLCGSFNCGRGR